ncbi:TetR/AcrR family transcriptional regulator [Paenibacillus piri]|uniref:TetR/AcrR family transcriptional regulator n=1 Tax=Paenibacillus piri TaxID=2547395 RepID=A0A4R5K9X1_9BACL|nr:TetR/AcrR family transcriptional regulator [Paenibacillus piri]TDF89724.1 TetR/AcrR family transcriptional regulator [Paenibacillus piri]
MPLQLYEKEAVLVACLSVFARHGYTNTSTGMLAEEAGISKALIFHHFNSKKKLYFSLLEHCFEKARTELRMDSVLEYQDFFEAIDKFSRIKFNYFRKFSDEYKLVYEAFYSPPDELKRDIEEKYGYVIANKNTVWEQLFEKVSLREGVDRKQAFELIVITLEHFEKKFLAEVADIDAIDDEYARNLFEKMNCFCSMIRDGIVSSAHGREIPVPREK